MDRLGPKVRKRQLILALAAVLVLAIAIPAIAGSGGLFNLANQASKKATRALQRSHRALNQANRALKRGHNARITADAASSTATSANQTATGASQQLAATRILSAEDSGTVTTASQSYVDLGGPTVNVTVAQSGLVDVWAQADIEDNSDGGAIAVFMDGQLVPGQAPICDPDIAHALILWEGTGGGGPVRVATPSAVIATGGCGTLGPPGPVQIQVSPGAHSFELRYADPCPCGSSQFSNRLLRVGPQL